MCYTTEAKNFFLIPTKFDVSVAGKCVILLKLTDNLFELSPEGVSVAGKCVILLKHEELEELEDHNGFSCWEMCYTTEAVPPYIFNMFTARVSVAGKCVILLKHTNYDASLETTSLLVSVAGKCVILLKHEELEELEDHNGFSCWEMCYTTEAHELGYNQANSVMFQLLGNVLYY